MAVDNDIASDDESVPAAFLEDTFLEAFELFRSQMWDKSGELRIDDEFAVESFQEIFAKSRHDESFFLGCSSLADDMLNNSDGNGDNGNEKPEQSEPF